MHFWKIDDNWNVHLWYIGCWVFELEKYLLSIFIGFSVLANLYLRLTLVWLIFNFDQNYLWDAKIYSKKYHIKIWKFVVINYIRSINRLSFKVVKTYSSNGFEIYIVAYTSILSWARAILFYTYNSLLINLSERHEKRASKNTVRLYCRLELASA